MIYILAEINKYLWGTETCQTLYKHHISGRWEGWPLTTIGLSLLSLLLAELTSSLSLRDFNLTSDHSVHTSHSHSLCGVRCETHVTDVTGEDNRYVRIIRGGCPNCRIWPSDHPHRIRIVPKWNFFIHIRNLLATKFVNNTNVFLALLWSGILL